MARLDRKLLKLFAKDAVNNGQFGSAQLGTKVITNNIDTIQALPAWLNGWLDATISARKFPPVEEFQSLSYVLAYQLSYMFQQGIPEYLSTETYYINSVVRKTGTYELYGSKIDDNTGNALPDATDDANWEFLVDLSLEQKIPYGTTTNTGNAYDVTTDPVFTVMTDGFPFLVKFNAPNDGPGTLNPNSTTDIDLVCNGQPLQGGEISADAIYLVVYDEVEDVLNILGGAPVYADDAQTIDGLLDNIAVTPQGLAALTSTDARRGLIEIATTAETGTGTDAERAIVPANLKAAQGFIKMFETAEYVLSAPSSNSEAHGLGAVPKLVEGFMRCAVADRGYAVGDIVPFSYMYSADGRGINAWMNSTHVGYSVGSTLIITGKTGSGGGFMTMANWRVFLRVWG